MKAANNVPGSRVGFSNFHRSHAIFWFLIPVETAVTLLVCHRCCFLPGPCAGPVLSANSSASQHRFEGKLPSFGAGSLLPARSARGPQSLIVVVKGLPAAPYLGRWNHDSTSPNKVR